MVGVALSTNGVSPWRQLILGNTAGDMYRSPHP